MLSSDLRQMLLSLVEACDYPRHHSSAHAVDAVALTSETRVNVFKGKFGVNDRVQPCFVKLTDLTRTSNLHSR